MDAKSRGDINAMEQNKNSLLKSATEDYKKTVQLNPLKEMPL